RSALLSWAGSALLLAGLVQVLAWGALADLVANPWLVACLLHATLTLLASLVLRVKVRAAADPLPSDLAAWATSLFELPLSHSALVSSLLVVPLLGLTGQVESVAWGSLWLAGIWLMAAWVDRRPGLFTAFQMALVAAVLAGVTAWLQSRGLTA